MHRTNSPCFWTSATLLAAMLASGCATTFNAQNAREVTRERLLELSEAGKSDHLFYVGSDLGYHYVFDSRPTKGRSYKIRADNMTLRDTFRVGEDGYVLYPWVIEGKTLGSKTEEVITNEPPAEDDR